MNSNSLLVLGHTQAIHLQALTCPCSSMKSDHTAIQAVGSTIMILKVL